MTDTTFALPRGVTGFRRVGEGPAPVVQPRDFLGACHAIARAQGWDVAAHDDAADSAARSFHRVLVRPRARDLAPSQWLVCNRAFPLVALARARVEPDGTAALPFPLDFVRPPSSLLAPEPFALVPFEQLVRPLQWPSDPALRALGEAELDQLRYWMPRRLGDVIFNPLD